MQQLIISFSCSLQMFLMPITNAKKYRGYFLFSKSLPSSWNTKLSNRHEAKWQMCLMVCCGAPSCSNVVRRWTFFLLLFPSQLTPQIKGSCSIWYHHPEIQHSHHCSSKADLTAKEKKSGILDRHWNHSGCVLSSRHTVFSAEASPEGEIHLQQETYSHMPILLTEVLPDVVQRC